MGERDTMKQAPSGAKDDHPGTGERRVRGSTEIISYAPLGLVDSLRILPTACAVGCILPPLCGWEVGAKTAGAATAVVQK